MAEPIQGLYREHRKIEVVLSRMDDAAELIHQGGPVNQGEAERILEVLRVFVDRIHHGKEEHYLFHVMTRHGLPPDGFPIGVLHAEHHQGRGYVGGMAEALAPASAGDARARRRLMRGMSRFTALLREHIPKEEMTLFTMSEVSLSAPEKAYLATVFDVVEQRERAQATLGADWAWLFE